MTFPEVKGPIWMIGCGNMGSAMLRRWIASGLDAALVTVVTRSGVATVPAGVRVLTAIPSGELAAIVVLAVKPQQLAVVAPSLASVRPPLLISILAGVEIDVLAKSIPTGAIVRAMPNLPVSIGQGVVALFADNADANARTIALALMSPLGLVEWIDDEAQFDAVTALAGSGPGFVFRVIDALADGGAALGILPAQAARLALATLAGAGALARQTDHSPAALADLVASPGGSTREGLNILDHDKALTQLMHEALAAAAKRNREMAEAARS